MTYPSANSGNDEPRYGQRLPEYGGPYGENQPYPGGAAPGQNPGWGQPAPGQHGQGWQYPNDAGQDRGSFTEQAGLGQGGQNPFAAPPVPMGEQGVPRKPDGTPRMSGQLKFGVISSYVLGGLALLIGLWGLAALNSIQSAMSDLNIAGAPAGAALEDFLRAGIIVLTVMGAAGVLGAFLTQRANNAGRVILVALTSLYIISVIVNLVSGVFEPLSIGMAVFVVAIARALFTPDAKAYFAAYRDHRSGGSFGPPGPGGPGGPGAGPGQMPPGGSSLF